MKNNIICIPSRLVTKLMHRIPLIMLLVFLGNRAQAHNTNYQRLVFANQAYDVIQITPANVNLHWKDSNGKPYQYFSSLKKDLTDQGKTVIAMMNAGIYSKNFSPAGVHVENGSLYNAINTKAGKGNFHIQPNGVFIIDRQDNPSVLTTKDYVKKYTGNHHDLRLATQSGPMLLINGKLNTKLIPQSQSFYRRNGVCVTRSNKLFFVATARSVTTNFFQFARAMKQLDCHNALYLDGSISKMYTNGHNSTFHFSPFVGILSVTQP